MWDEELSSLPRASRSLISLTAPSREWEQGHVDANVHVSLWRNTHAHTGKQTERVTRRADEARSLCMKDWREYEGARAAGGVQLHGGGISVQRVEAPPHASVLLGHQERG